MFDTFNFADWSENLSASLLRLRRTSHFCWSFFHHVLPYAPIQTQIFVLDITQSTSESIVSDLLSVFLVVVKSGMNW